MILGIMQPYFFPSLSHFSLINAVDKWVVFDDVQFIRHGWIERNRILKQNEDWQYVKVPLVKHSRGTLIKDIRIREEDWQNKLLSQLNHYKKRTRRYPEVMDLLNDWIRVDTDSIVELNCQLYVKLCEYLGVEFDFEVFSEMDLNLGEIEHPGSWALEISKSLDAKMYVNPIGGKDIFVPEDFAEAGIDLKFLKFEGIEYSQNRDSFEPHLSIIDALMFNSPKEIVELISNYSLV